MSRPVITWRRRTFPRERRPRCTSERPIQSWRPRYRSGAAPTRISEDSGRKDSQVIRTAILVATALSTAPPVSALGQQLKLSADVGKTEFFEGEPIYLLVRLENVGTDTAWITFFGSGSLPMMLSLARANGNPVPVHMPFID